MSWVVAAMILGPILGCWVGMGWRYAGVWRAEWRADRIRAAARMLKTSHRETLAKMELGWRERDEIRRAALEKQERRRLAEVVKRLHELLGCMQGIAQDALKETAPIPHADVAKVLNKLCTDIVVPVIKYAEPGE